MHLNRSDGCSRVGKASPDIISIKESWGESAYYIADNVTIVSIFCSLESVRTRMIVVHWMKLSMRMFLWSAGIGSNKLTANPILTARSWDRIAHSVHVYNKHMGGIDPFDQHVPACRVQIRLKKCWWPLIAWSLSAQVVYAFFQYRKKEPGISTLEFSRNLVRFLLKSYGVQRKQPGPKSNLLLRS